MVPKVLVKETLYTPSRKCSFFDFFAVANPITDALQVSKDADFALGAEDRKEDRLLFNTAYRCLGPFKSSLSSFLLHMSTDMRAFEYGRICQGEQDGRSLPQ